MKLLQGTVFVVAGLCWILAASVCFFLLFQYISEGAGLQFFPLPLSSGSVLVGLVHVVGFVSGSVICFAVGIALCAHGLVSRS
jgi:hypothetical protein